MKRANAVVFFLVSLALFPTMPAFAQREQSDASAFRWTGRVPPGQTIRVRNLNGPIIVTAANGDNVEVTGTKKWRRGDPSVVRFETKKLGAGEGSMLVCALWGDNSSCDEQGYHSHDDGRDSRMRNNDVSVEFRVAVPRGVRVAVGTINGDVTVDGATTDVDAATVNGEVDASSLGGRVRADNVNGGVRVRLGRLDGYDRVDAITVNGSVAVEFTGDAGADLDMATVNGSLNTNFEMTLSGRLDPKRLRSHVGRPGGPRIRLVTVNGNVDIKRR